MELFVSRYEAAPEKEKMTPVKNTGSFKPTGGLWTSLYLGPEAGSEWVQWIYDNKFLTIASAYVMKPDPAAHIFTIDSVADLERLMTQYGQRLFPGSGLFTPDYEAFAVDYDALHVTKNGEAETRFSMPYSLYGYDVESTLWCRWCFRSVQPIETSFTHVVPF